MHKTYLLIRFDCLGCQGHYYLDYVMDGSYDYFCPHCGQKGKNVGKSLAQDVIFDDEIIEVWESGLPCVRELVRYLGEHYPDGHAEDIFHEVEQAIYGGEGIEKVFYYEDDVLKQLIETVILEIRQLKNVE